MDFEKNKTPKPLGKPVYGSIAHLPESRMGIGDKRITEGQARICWEKARDKHDTIVVQEKTDGSCVSVAKKDGQLLVLTRAGYEADTSKYKQHHIFKRWVEKNRSRFNDFLKDGERIVGEWLIQAHGTKYNLQHEPFVAFDLMREGRVDWSEFKDRVSKVFVTPRLIHEGGPFSKVNMLEAMTVSGHGADECEGVVYKVFRKDKFDYAAKYVRGDYQAGKYLPEISGCPSEVWNWHEDCAARATSGEDK